MANTIKYRARNFIPIRRSLPHRFASNMKSSAQPTPTKIEIAVVCPPGLEEVTGAEIRDLGIAVIRQENGLLACSGAAEELYRLNLHLRTASRVLLRIGGFNAAAFSELEKKAARLPWSEFLRTGQSVHIRVSAAASRLYHKKGIAERVINAIAHALGGPVHLRESVAADEEDPTAQLIVVRLVRNFCTISIDSSGEHLHRRGYRLAVGKAPLRENLAAALLLASGWDRQSPLVDPFCGSGVIPIEAALLARNIAPGLHRSFAFEQWPSFQPGTWQGIQASADASIHAGVTPFIAGSDRDAGAIEMSRANADRAGVADLIHWTRRSISDLILPELPGWMVTNPPYGERIKGGVDPRNLYARLGSVWRERAGLWHNFLVSANPRWTGHMGMAGRKVLAFNHGGINVWLMEMKPKQTDEGT
ncbi:MAG: THUMP domain-containing class I SAM-dependent RNA methyltransferase [Kiritimatiellia bacterium]